MILLGVFATLVIIMLIIYTILTRTAVLRTVSDQRLLVVFCHFTPEVAYLLVASVILRRGGLDVPHDDLGVSGACASVCND